MQRALLLLCFAACASTPPEPAGRVCFVIDLRRPYDCPAAQQVDGIDVHDVGTDAHTKTAADGSFPLRATTFAFAEDRSDLRTSVIGVDATSTDVIAPLVTHALWDSYIQAVHLPPDDPTLAVVHVAFPPPGVLVGSATIAGASHVYYNQGDSYAWAEMPPGDQTIVLMGFGVPTTTGTTTVTVTGRDDHVYTADVPVRPGAISWVRFDP